MLNFQMTGENFALHGRHVRLHGFSASWRVARNVGKNSVGHATFIALIALGIVSLPVTIRAQQQSRNATKRIVRPKAVVAYKDGRLSVKADDVSLIAVLGEISRRARVAIVGPEGAAGKVVSAQFEDVPIDEGLRRILTDYDTFFYYGKENQGSAFLRAVWVYPGGKARGYEPVPPDQWASTKELEQMSTDPDPSVRSQALKGLIERKGDKAVDVVLKALRDPDSQVQWEALYDAQGTGVQLSADTLENLALHGSSPEEKVLALDGLKGNPDLQSIAQQALQDPDTHVQNKAREILSELAPPPLTKPAQQALQSQPKPQQN